MKSPSFLVSIKSIFYVFLCSISFCCPLFSDEVFATNEELEFIEEGSTLNGEISYKYSPLLSSLWGDSLENPATNSVWSGRVGIALEHWSPINGGAVKDLIDSDVFYGAPQESRKLSSSNLTKEDAATYPSAVNGVRMRGLLIIPEDGEYTFALAADDSADLWLGEPGGSRFTKKKILSCPRWTNPNNWDAYRTSSRTYKAGDIIWLEVLSKNQGGDQHLSIAWKRPDAAGYEEIPSVLEDGTIVLTVPPVDPADIRDIGVPQSWLDSVGLGTANPVTDPRVRLYNDTDGDGFNLLEEYQTGGRPDEVGGNSGHLNLERWNNVSGGNMEGFVKTEKALQAPDSVSCYSGSFDIDQSGNYYALRTRALLQAPRNGEWTFYIAGDDDAWLSLSPDESRFLKRRIARNGGYTGRYEWTKRAVQKSEPVILHAGQRYFLETFLYQITGAASVAVAWEHTPENLCLLPGATASQSSMYGSNDASLAIDGDRSTHNHTNSTGSSSWLEVDFGAVCDMNQVVIYNRTDATNGRRLANFRLQILDENGDEIIGEDFFTESGTWAGSTVIWDMPETVRGRKVRIQQLGKNGHDNYYLHVKEIEVYEQTEFSQGPVVIDARYLHTIPVEAEDQDNNSIPDSWQREKGLIPGQNGLSAMDCSEYGDPDNDLAVNQVEYLLSTNPLVPSGVPGHLTRDLWKGVAGWSVDDSMRSHAVLGVPTTRELLEGADAPRNIGSDYHQRLRGTIKPPVSGEYTFWISSDETSILYLSHDDRKFGKQEIARVGYGSSDRGVYLAKYNEWDAFPKQRSASIYLETGREYYIEAHHKQYHSIDHLQIAWQIPGGQREVIPSEYLVSFGGDLSDRDDDDLPDEWEAQYGISAVDNGYSNYDNGAWGDPWGTGITNREAYLRGWNPQAPELPDPGTLVQDIPATSGVPQTGSWSIVGNTILTPIGRGTIAYNNILLPEGGRYLLEISARPSGNILEIETIDISATVNEQHLGSRTLRSLKGAEGKIHFLLPQLPEGNCNVSLSLNNIDLRRTFQITGVRIIRPDQLSGEQEGNSAGDSWLTDYLQSANSITSCASESYTSPLCVEGKTRALHQARLTVPGTDSSPLLPLGSNTWYANIVLPADGSPLTFSASFEDGAHTSTATTCWKASDLLLKGDLTLRKGDSIRACIGSDDESAPSFPVVYALVNREGEIIGTWSGSTSTPLPMQFDVPGTHTLTASWQAGEGETLQTSLSVTVADIDMGGLDDLITGLARTFDFTEVSDQVSFTANSPLKLRSAYGTAADGTRRLELYSEQGGAQYLIARLGASTGPVIKTKPLFSHNNTGSSTLSRIETVQEFGDGSSLLCFYLASESLPEGGYIKISLIAGGVQFLEGGKEKKIYAEDFDENGLLRILLTCPPGGYSSVCHYIRYYTADGKQL